MGHIGVPTGPSSMVPLCILRGYSVARDGKSVPTTGGCFRKVRDLFTVHVILNSGFRINRTQ